MASLFLRRTNNQNEKFEKFNEMFEEFLNFIERSAPENDEIQEIKSKFEIAVEMSKSFPLKTYESQIFFFLFNFR